MKKKQLTYILLPLVIFIWGYIFFKFFNDTQVSDNPQLKIDTQSLSFVSDSAEFTFALNKNYRDPFLGVVTNSIPKSKWLRKEIKPKTPPLTVVFPIMVYNGIITSHENKKKIGLLIIEGHNHMVQQNETVGELFIKFLYKDSAIVLLNNVKKSIKKHL